MLANNKRIGGMVSVSGILVSICFDNHSMAFPAFYSTIVGPRRGITAKASDTQNRKQFRPRGYGFLVLFNLSHSLIGSLYA